MNPDRREKVEANITALILIAAVNNPEKEPIKIGDIKKHLMGPPFEKSLEEATEITKNISGIKLKGEGDDATISSINISTFVPIKQVLPFALKIRPFLPDELFAMIKEEDALIRKIALIVGLMDHIGIMVYQEQVRQVLKEMGWKRDPKIKIDPFVQAMSSAVRNGWVAKPYAQKGVNVVLESGDQEYEGVKGITALYDEILIKNIKDAQPKPVKPTTTFSMKLTGDVDATVVIREKHSTLDIVASDNVKDKVTEAVREFAAKLATIKE